MSAKRHLSPLQFQHSVSKDNNYHMVEAHHPEHGEVGYMSWAKNDTGLHQPGEIANIQTHEPYQRQGVATAIYNHALASGYSPAPVHSRSLTQRGGGQAWSEHVGGPSVKPRKLK